MNGEKPKFKPWKEIVDESKETIKFMKQQLAIQEAILDQAELHVNTKK